MNLIDYVKETINYDQRLDNKNEAAIDALTLCDNLVNLNKNTDKEEMLKKIISSLGDIIKEENIIVYNFLKLDKSYGVSVEKKIDYYNKYKNILLKDDVFLKNVLNFIFNENNHSTNIEFNYYNTNLKKYKPMLDDVINVVYEKSKTNLLYTIKLIRIINFILGNKKTNYLEIDLINVLTHNNLLKNLTKQIQETNFDENKSSLLINIFKELIKSDFSEDKYKQELIESTTIDYISKISGYEIEHIKSPFYFKKITSFKKFPIYKSEDSKDVFNNKNELLESITKTSHIEHGKYIRIANYILNILEKNYELGICYCDYFIEDIKNNLVLDKKSQSLDGVDLLIYYIEKKSKKSVTLENSMLKVKNAKSMYEQDKLNREIDLVMNKKEDVIKVKKNKI